MFSIPSRASDDGFRAFIPSSIRPRKVNTTKRKQKNKAAENKLGDKGPSVNCTENKVADILQQKITLLPAPVSIATAGATVTLNDQGIHLDVAALYRKTDGCEAKDDVAIVEGEQNIANTSRTNSATELCPVNSTSAHCMLTVEDVATTGDYNSSFANHDFGRQQPYSETQRSSFSEGDQLRLILEEQENIGTSASHMNSTHSRTIDVPSPGSFDGAATGKPSEPGEQLPSSPDILIHDAKDLDCGSQLNRNHGPLEACTASDTAELTAASTADAHLPGSGFDCDREPKGSPETSAFGVCSPAENVSESAVRQERLHSIDGSDSHSEAADQRVAFKLTDTRDEGGRSNLDLNQIMRELGELGGDERHRSRVEITEHQEWNGEKRYGFKTQGCPEDETRWDGESYFDECPEVIEEYWNRVRSQHSIINATEGEVCRSPSSSRISCEIKLANDSEEGPTALSEDEEDEKDEYQVERIVKHRERNGQRQFKVKWKGYPEEEMTWEPKKHFYKCPEVIEEYWDRVRSQHSIINATEGEVCRSPSSSRIPDDRASVLHPMIEMPVKAASTCKVHKRKLSQDVENLSCGDREYLNDSSDAGVRTKCTKCRKTGHNKATCPDGAVETSH
ncbi:unnamed protein product [Alternaria alternata]